jgi:hypothetical protein
MAQMLFRYKNNVRVDPDKDRQGSYKKGYPVSIKPDGWYEGNPNWAQSTYADKTKWFVVDVTDATVEELQTYIRDWKDSFDYEILSATPATGRYTVRVFETNVSTSGLNTMTQAKVGSFLNRWRCSNISATTNSVQFDFSLWDAVRSEGFWELNLLIQYPIEFVLVSYSATTGIGEIRATVPIALRPEIVTRRIIDRGGTIISAIHPVYVFEIERSDILQKFRADVKMWAERIYKRRQFYLTEAQADAIHAMGGYIQRTKGQLLAELRNGLDD